MVSVQVNSCVRRVTVLICACVFGMAAESII